MGDPGLLLTVRPNVRLIVLRCQAIRNPSEQAIKSIECRDAIRFGHRWIIEGRVDEIIERILPCWLLHDRLSDVDDLGSIFTKAMDTENFACLAVEQDLKHSHAPTRDLRTCQTLELRVPHFIRNFFFSQLPFGLADRTDFRACINPIGNIG